MRFKYVNEPTDNFESAISMKKWTYFTAFAIHFNLEYTDNTATCIPYVITLSRSMKMNLATKMLFVIYLQNCSNGSRTLNS